MVIYFVDFPMKNGWIFPVRYVKLPVTGLNGDLFQRITMDKQH